MKSEPESGELLRLAASYSAEADAEERLAGNLAQSGLAEAATNNRHRAKKHRRTAEILQWLASFDERGPA